MNKIKDIKLIKYNKDTLTAFYVLEEDEGYAGLMSGEVGGYIRTTNWMGFDDFNDFGSADEITSYLLENKKVFVEGNIQHALIIEQSL